LTNCGRGALVSWGVVTARDLTTMKDGRRVVSAGMVIVRQRPSTAKGFFFASLEDETGIVNLIVTPLIFERDRVPLVTAPFLWVEGLLQNQDGVAAIKVRRVRPLAMDMGRVPSYDFR